MSETRNAQPGPAPTFEGLLGDLERDIMEVVWARGEVSVHEVQDALEDRRAPAYTTIMTVMSRLHDKGVLARRREGRAFIYRAAQEGRSGFLRQQARQRVHELLNQFGDLAVAEFVGELSGSPEQIEALESLLGEHRESPEA